MNPSLVIVERFLNLAAKLPGNVMDQAAQIVWAREPSKRRSRLADSIPHAHYRSLCLGFLQDWRAKALRGSRQPRSHRPANRRLFAEVTRGRPSGRDRLDRTTLREGLLPAHGTGHPANPEFGTEPDLAGELRRVLDPEHPGCGRASRQAGREDHRGRRDARQAGHAERILDAASPGRRRGEMLHGLLLAKENRKADASGKLGILHVKCVVGDGRWLFLSSANLTKYAFSLNMELGVLITGGKAPQIIEAMFETLIREGVFAAVS